MRRESKQLGMDYGTASSRLRKLILFTLLQQFKVDICYRCCKQIETVDELSIEHKKPWLDVNPKLFWDMRNIAFSHIGCNSSSGRRYISKHGTKRRYTFHGCRCKPCTRANSIYKRQQRSRLKSMP